MARHEWQEVASATRVFLKDLWVVGLFVSRQIFWFIIKFILSVPAFIVGGIFGVLSGPKEQRD